MKKVALVILSLYPLAVGYFNEYLMMEHNFYGCKIDFISILFLISWFVVGYLSGKMDGFNIKSFLLGNYR